MSNFVPEKTALGIEFGSTRIKAVLIGPEHTPLAQGDYTWENQLHNGIWTYPLEQVWQGLQSAYAALAADVQQKYGCTLTKVGCIGISAMMHGYLAFDANGKLLRQEDIIDYTRTNIKGEYASLSDFIHKWKASDKKKTIEQSFMAMGIDLKALKADQGMSDVDDFDFICYVAYGRKPLTRKERANNVKKKDFFSKYSAEAQAVLSILLDKYMNQGITEVEDIKVLSLADFAEFGKPAKIVKLFGGKAQYEAAIKELEANIYELEVS